MTATGHTTITHDTIAAAETAAPEIVAEEHWAKKGDVDLFMFRKYAPAVAPAKARRVLFLVHGSSQSARTSYDLTVPGKGEFSLMNVFARWGFDVWTMDHEGYGRSSRTEGFSYIKDGVEDLKAAAPVVESATGRAAFDFFGTSSGALRAGAFCNACPERVERLALSAFPWTGEGAPSLIKRRERLAEWQASNRREVDEAYYHAMYTRDVVGLTDPDLPAAAAAAEMANGGGSVPNGTYVDMCINLPVVDPAKIACPVLMIRGDHDGITTDEDNAAFFAALATKDKHFVRLSGQAHNITVGVNRHRFWHVLHAFLELPERVDGGVA
ncbi:MAG TPA: alpha/beta fold hydrolase [Kiloniellales bacterium]|nr:alpha/beta fold hydrolase [Kiloniellales bacterium]